ncbi:LLM class flavin-dependent oxidoreductase [Sulfolobus sp. E11-6]|uniref:LLM class flavin-dependent oxidoreductase n=1 Tax=Sulfolobus sp. E11-6 TaxID=2663020 RepID=UPI001295FA20|nr:LLM class flavin-dependent oxidoreductase [Sulfolobus sp. E11-6]QGA69010.1 LLM class flavin-dependent oxidoreductase [Sulfolobus sp. E11-6]
MDINFGVFTHPILPEDLNSINFVRYYKDQIKLVKEAEKLGYEYYFFAEHHFSRLGGNPSQGVFLSSVCQHTSKIRIGSLAYVVPIRNPLHLAEELALLDNLCEGRLDVGLTGGISELELKEVGLDPKLAKVMSREATTVLLEFLKVTSQGRKFTFKGEYYKFEEVERLIPYVQKPYPPIWIPTRTIPTTIWAAQNGLNLVTGIDIDEIVRERIEAYRNNFNGNGNPKLAIEKYVYISNSEEKLRKLLPIMLKELKGAFLDLQVRKSMKNYEIGETRKTEGFTPPEFYRYDDVEYMLNTNRLLAGKPREVSDKVKKVLERTTANTFLVHIDWITISYEDNIENLELFANEVIPEIQKK